jgi:hypothetical protein
MNYARLYLKGYLEYLVSCMLCRERTFAVFGLRISACDSDSWETKGSDVR